MVDTPDTRSLDPADLTGRERYQLLTSVVVPRPIGWISTWSVDGRANVAPYSFFNAVAASPMLVVASIGQRGGGPKDTLINVRSRRAFCVNVVTEPQLEAMNATSAEVAPEVDEFELAGLTRATSERVDAPYVADCPVVLECELRQEVDLGDAPNTLIIGEVVHVRLAERLRVVEGSMVVEVDSLAPVGRLSGAEYMLPSRVKVLPRPSRPER